MATVSTPSVAKPDEPDHDTIKMFVGQIPRGWTEDDCRTLFEEFGPVYQLNVLRDKTTQASKGCCFVTYYHRKDAIGAQATLHNIKVLPGMHHPVQMKPADSENRNERKLFVGMLNKKLNEDDVRSMFTQFGHIEDCTVLKDADGRSKGCAFVTFGSRAFATQAIKAMHHSQTMEGCSTPLVVKFADTQRDKESRKGTEATSTTPAATSGAADLGQLALLQQLLQPTSQLGTLAALLQTPAAAAQNNVLALLGNVLNGLARLSEATSAPSAGSSNSSASALFSASSANNVQSLNSAPSLSSLQQLDSAALLQQQQLAAVQQQQQQQRLYELLQQQQNAALHAAGATNGLSSDLLLGHGATAFAGGTATAAPASVAGQSLHQFASPATSSPETLAIHQSQIMQPSPPKEATSNMANLIHLTGAAAAPNPFDPYGVHQNYLLAAQQQQQQLALLGAGVPAAAHAVVGNTSGGGQSKGPEGSNLFIYHLPQDYTDSDLHTTFAPFGNVLSAKVFIDKQTNLSKCFGFVSYDNATSAQNAIAAMNGFQIGTKRLKVQLKGARAPNAKPYSSGTVNGSSTALTSLS